MKSEIMHDLYTIKPICKIMYAKLHTAKSAETVVFCWFLCVLEKRSKRGELGYFYSLLLRQIPAVD